MTTRNTHTRTHERRQISRRRTPDAKLAQIAIANPLLDQWIAFVHGSDEAFVDATREQINTSWKARGWIPRER